MAAAAAKYSWSKTTTAWRTQAVRTGSIQDGQWFVIDGLKAGDRVVVEGFQKFAAGDKVKPQVWTAAEASADGGRDAHPTMQARR